MITGSAGCQEKHDPWLPMPGITAFRSADYGFTRMKAHNSSHMEIEQISDDKVLRMILANFLNHIHVSPAYGNETKLLK